MTAVVAGAVEEPARRAATAICLPTALACRYPGLP
jgi:hypothetical protein